MATRKKNAAKTGRLVRWMDGAVKHRQRARGVVKCKCIDGELGGRTSASDRSHRLLGVRAGLLLLSGGSPAAVNWLGAGQRETAAALAKPSGVMSASMATAVQGADARV